MRILLNIGTDREAEAVCALIKAAAERVQYLRGGRFDQQQKDMTADALDNASCALVDAARVTVPLKPTLVDELEASIAAARSRRR